jgi:uncharacterized OsmC-like protein
MENKDVSKLSIKVEIDQSEVDTTLEKFREMERIYDKIHSVPEIKITMDREDIAKAISIGVKSALSRNTVYQLL